MLTAGTSICALDSDPDFDAQMPLVTVLFTANINGNIENCNCGDPPLGGLDYLATLIKNERRKSTPVLFIDGGDYFNSYPYLALNEAAADILLLIRPEGFLPGDQEFAEDKVLLTRLFKQNNILGSNFRFASFPAGKVLHRALDGNRMLAVAGYLSPDSFSEKIPDDIRFNEKEFEDIYANRTANSIFVTVFHGTAAALRRFVQAYPKTDLILWAHEQSNLIEKRGATTIVGGCSDGEYLTIIRLFIGTDNKVQWNVERKAVTKKYDTDKNVRRIIEYFHKKNKNQY